MTRTSFARTARKLLPGVLLASAALTAAPALAGPTLISDQATFTGLNPGYTEDKQYGTDFSVISNLTLDDGTQLHFTGPVDIRTVPTTWATWCCGYTDQVLYTDGATSLTIDALTGIDAFGFYAEPDTKSNFFITLLLQDGSSLTKLVNGNGGASFFGFSGGGVQSMTVSSTDGLGFAIGDFFVLPLPEPGTWAMMLLGFAGIGTVMRRKNAASHIAQIA